MRLARRLFVAVALILVCPSVLSAAGDAGRIGKYRQKKSSIGSCTEEGLSPTTRLVAQRPHPLLIGNHLARVGQVGEGKALLLML